MSSLHYTANAIRNKTPIDRLFDPQYKQGSQYKPGSLYKPGPQFDFAYARRRARQQATKFIAPSNIVLDVGGATSSFACITNAKVTVIDDGAAGKRVMNKPWRNGVFPKLSEFDTATFPFSLEYIEHPRRMLAAILNRGLRVIPTYHCIDNLPNELRKELDFTSHLSRTDWITFASSITRDFCCDWAFDGFQSSKLLNAIHY
ncbi:hypothetical protein N9D23_01825 [Rubripirellula sp.]|nr:hypothetical protein [Rubripirellula sp.]